MKRFLSCILALTLALSLTACGGTSSSTPSDSSSTPQETTDTAQPSEDTTQTEESADQPEEDNTADMTMGQKNALGSAKSYLELMAFSHDGLVQQLESEQYTHEDAVFAADNCGADWNEQAVKAAAAYLDMMSFSRDGLIEQLEFDGFTAEQADYGATQNGY